LRENTVNAISNPIPPGTSPPAPTQTPSPTSTPGQEPSLLQGVNVLLEGPTGTGKTYSIGTLVETGVEVFFLGLEAGAEALFGYFTDRGKPIPENLHWHVMNMARKDGFAALAAGAQQIGAMTFESMTKIQDFTRAQNNAFERFLRVMNDFQDQRTGKSFGAVDTWGPDRAIVIDGLTGLSNFAKVMVVGAKPVMNLSDYGVAQDQIERLIRYTCDGCKCHFVLLAHVERETDQILGGSKITVSTLGRALSPKIPPMFSDVIFSVRNGTEWVWNTAHALCDLKTRNLPYAEKITPDFRQIMEKWKSRGGRFSPLVKV
jgi:AAA domain-containing protein